MESFFLACSSLDEETELKELLLRRYHSLDFMEDMDLVEFLNFCVVAKKKEREERIFMQWCAMLPPMMKYMEFEEFRDTVTGANIDTRPTSVIIAEIQAIHEQKGGKNGTGNI